jgi:nucleotide-binding universal stress UspA family protein
MPIKRVLVATDLGARSLAIARSAIELARMHRAGAVVLHAVSPLADLPLDANARADFIGRSVDRARARLADIEHAEVEVVVGPAAAVICERAESSKADLIVLGARAADDPLHLLVGSTSLQVARNAACPADRPGAAGDIAIPPPARRRRPRRAVAPGDRGRGCPRRARRFHRAGSRHRRRRALPTDLADAASRARLETLEKLHRFVREIDVATVPIETRAKLGRVADRILEAAAIGHRDLIAIGARRRDNPDAVLGTIADRVLRCATVPVLIVPPTD